MRPTKIILIIPALVYVLIAVIWHENHINEITGDEPHYLMITDSLIRDKDFWLVNNYEVDTPVSREFPPIKLDPSLVAQNLPSTQLDPLMHAKNGFSIHGSGLPLLLVPAYFLDDIMGAKIFLAIIAGLIPLAIYRLSRLILIDEEWSLVISVVVALGMPFLAASNQIYPDLISGLIVFYLLIRLFEIHSTQKISLNIFQVLILSVLIGYLPWLHVKMILPMLILYFFFAALFIKCSRGPDQSIHPLLVMSAVIAFSLMSLGFFNEFAFHSFLGPYGSGDAIYDLQKVAMIFVGLHLDRMQGLFVQAPLFLLGAFGITFFFVEKRFFAIVTSLTYLSIIVFNSVHGNWYGGGSFSGRFHWSVILLWCFPLLYAIRYLMMRGKSALVLGALVTSLVIELVYSSIALSQNGYLYNKFGTGIPEWARSNPYADFLRLTNLQKVSYLPSFIDFNTYLRTTINWVYIGFVACTIFAGYCFYRRRYWLCATVSGFFIIFSVIALWISSPALQPATF